MVIWTSLVGLGDAALTHSVWKTLAARNYPSVVGRVLESRVDAVTARGTTYSPHIRYEYTVAGVRYESDHYRFGEMGNSRRAFADRVVAQYPAGSPVTVHFDSQVHNEAVVVVWIDECHRWWFVFMTPFNLFMLGGWVSVLSMTRPRARPHTIAGSRVREGPPIQIGMQPFPIWAVAWGSAFVASFLGMAAIVFLLRETTTAAVLIYLGSCALVGVVVAAVYARRIATGHYRLTIDPIRRTMSLPRRRGKAHREVHFDSIASIEVRDAPGPTRRSAPAGRVVVSFKADTPPFQDASGSEVALGDWPHKNDAILFRDYLAERLGLKADAPTPPPQDE